MSVVVGSLCAIACNSSEMKGVAKMAACLESSSRTTCIQRQLIETSESTHLSAGRRVTLEGTPYEIEVASDGWLQIPSGAEQDGLRFVHESGAAYLEVEPLGGKGTTARAIAREPMGALVAKLEAEPDEVATDSGFFGDEEAVLLSLCFRTQAGSSYPEFTECWATAGVTRAEPAASIFAVADQDSAAFAQLGELINGFGLRKPENGPVEPAADR